MSASVPVAKAIDLFSGAGGLTLGLKNAGFDVVAGVEIDETIGLTYKANHPEVKLLFKDAKTVTGEEIRKVTGLKDFDLLAGCPPCQGFSKLTDKYRREDPRNQLVLEMARLVEELQPKMVMMENVPGLAGRGAPLLKAFIARIEAAGYFVNHAILQLANYGVPQSRRRLVLLAGRGFAIEIPKPTHSSRGKADGLRPWLNLRDAIKGAGTPVTLSRAVKKGGPTKFNWHVVRNLKPISVARYRALRAGNGRRALPEELRPDCHRNGRKGFFNVYGRMRWTQTPPTMTSGCTTPCKGRFGHPRRNGTISVREAAMIQTFPKSYVLVTERMEAACQLVGNALPPAFARVAGKSCMDALIKKGGE